MSDKTHNAFEQLHSTNIRPHGADAKMLSVDSHYIKDALGSVGEYTK